MSPVAIADTADFEPNPWNPNRMNAQQYAQLIHDIRTFGFIDPLTVRRNPSGKTDWQIIDGENRWRAARDLGIPVTFVEIQADDQQAQKLTVILNELRGQYDTREMGKLLENLLAQESPAQLLETLPFTHEALAGMVGLKDFDWKGLDQPAAKDKEPSPAKWVERTFRLPPDANEVLNAAIAKAKDGEDMADAQALEMIAADFLSG